MNARLNGGVIQLLCGSADPVLWPALCSVNTFTVKWTWWPMVISPCCYKIAVRLLRYWTWNWIEPGTGSPGLFMSHSKNSSIWSKMPFQFQVVQDSVLFMSQWDMKARTAQESGLQLMLRSPVLILIRLVFASQWHFLLCLGTFLMASDSPLWVLSETIWQAGWGGKKGEKGRRRQRKVTVRWWQSAQPRNRFPLFTDHFTALYL